MKTENVEKFKRDVFTNFSKTKDSADTIIIPVNNNIEKDLK